jgi:tRNA(fMet)-specific endonuclease VapC
MKPRYLLDTNTLSEPLKPVPHPQVVKQIQSHQYEIATASPVLYEIIQGAYRLPPSKKREAILQYVQDFLQSQWPILPYDEVAALWHGQESARLTKLGRVPSFIDGQIAAIAKVNDLLVVTRNINDFSGFEGLVIENWFV